MEAFQRSIGLLWSVNERSASEVCLWGGWCHQLMKIRHNKLYDTTHLLKPTSLKQKMKKSASAHREGGVYELRCRRPAGGHRNVCASLPPHVEVKPDWSQASFSRWGSEIILFQWIGYEFVFSQTQTLASLVKSSHSLLKCYETV